MPETLVAGKFIVIEGIDDQTIEEQGERLYGWLRGQRNVVHLTREPSDGPFGSQIRFIHDGRLEVDDLTLVLFYSTDRMDNLNKKGGILERLASGEHVICLRYYLSSYAEQTLCADLEWLRAINAECRRPDLTLFIDMPINACLESLVQSNFHTASELKQEREKLEKVRENYLTAIELLRREGEKIEIIKGNRPAAAIEGDVKRHVIDLMGQDTT
jgi:dTMP kinase